MKDDSDESERRSHQVTPTASSQQAVMTRSVTLPDSCVLPRHANNRDTPFLGVEENRLLKQQHTSHICDSGFSEWSPASSAAASLEDMTPSCEHGASCLQCSTISLSEANSSVLEFSPKVHRKSWPFKSRKLFLPADLLQSPILDMKSRHLQDIHRYEEEDAAGSNNELTSEEVAKIILRSEDPGTSKHNLLCKVLHRSRSSSRSPLSSTSDDLEGSFQEMSLEESSSSDSAQQSPALPSSSSPVFTFMRRHSLDQKKLSGGYVCESLRPTPESLHSHIPSSEVEENGVKKSSQDLELEVSSLPNLFSQHIIPSVKRMEALSSSRLKQSDFAASLSLLPTHPSQIEALPLPPHTITQLNQESCSLSQSYHYHPINHPHQIFEDVPEPTTCDLDFFKSPTKRNATFTQTTCSDSISPLKMRRLKGRSVNSTTQNSFKRDLFGCESSESVVAKDEVVSLPTPIRRKERSRIKSLDERVPQFLSIDNVRDVSEKSNDNVSKGVSHKETPVRCNISTTTTKDKDDVGQSCELEKKTEELLQRVCQMFSPNPSHLIGRQIGIKKFDIVGELQQRNLVGCLEMIFAHIPDCDLARLVDVSTEWKCALFDESKALKRYKAMVRRMNSPRKNRHHANKENVSEKLQPKENVGMTTSKGLLTSIQPQFVTKTDIASHLPQVSDLQHEDQVRNCPHCQCRAVILPSQDRAICMSEKCAYDFCTKCFFPFHHSCPCKPLFHASSKTTLAGTKKSKKNLKRLKNL